MTNINTANRSDIINVYTVTFMDLASISNISEINTFNGSGALTVILVLILK
ncbi:MAG: hypothetical protein QXY40_11710 [Candidatus Methanomethylicia archaeon]